MGTIVERKRKDGTVAYRAQIAIMRERKLVWRENKTFDRKPAARAWLKKREAELEQPGALQQSRSATQKTLGEAIDKYLAESKRGIGRSKTQVLKAIRSHDIADVSCAEVSSQRIVDFATELGTRMQPQTVGNYLSHLGAVFTVARPAWGFELDKQAMADAVVVLKRLGAVGKSRARDRLPTLDELDKLLQHFDDVKRRRPSSNPMVAICLFAIASTRRLEEITLIRWDDLDRAGKRILVRDMKNPGDKVGNDVWCDLPDPALPLIESMPAGENTIFGCNTDAVSAAFTRACKKLGIENLHFHDLRHEGISRLFEMGLNIPHVAAVSGHRSWTSLKRYAHIRASGDKYAGWRWFAPYVSAERGKGKPKR